jgi:hypothetical protein
MKGWVNNGTRKMYGRKLHWRELRHYFGIYLAGLETSTKPIGTIVTKRISVSVVVVIEVLNFRPLGNGRALKWVLRMSRWRECTYRLWARRTNCLFPASFLMSKMKLKKMKSSSCVSVCSFAVLPRIKTGMKSREISVWNRKKKTHQQHLCSVTWNVLER